MRRTAGLLLLLATAIGVGMRLRQGTSTRQASSDPRPVPPGDNFEEFDHPRSYRSPHCCDRTRPAGSARVVIERIQTEAGLTDRLSIRPDPSGWQRLSDDDLLRRLSDAGKPAGLAYVDGRAMLLFYNEPRDGTRIPPRLVPHWPPHVQQ